jgi:hypothetical protein
VKESLSPSKSVPKKKERIGGLNPVDSLNELTRHSEMLQSSQRCLPHDSSNTNTQASADVLRPLDVSTTALPGQQRKETKLELSYSRRRPVVPGSVVAKSLRLQQQQIANVLGLESMQKKHISSTRNSRATTGATAKTETT